MLFRRHLQNTKVRPQWAADTAATAVGPSIEDLIAVGTEQTRAVAVLAHFVVVVLHQVARREQVPSEVALVEWGRAKSEGVQVVRSCSLAVYTGRDTLH